MADSDDVYVLIASLFEVTRESLKMGAGCLTATPALIGAVSEQMPELAAR